MQNVDGLSVRSDQEVAASYPELEKQEVPTQPPMLEMHGTLFDLLCTNRKCKHVKFNAESPICEGLAGTEMLIETKTTDPDIELEDLRRCSKCGGRGRPGVVWFGETPHHLDTIDGLVAQADLCLVIGTSSNVYPAASYAAEVKRHGGKVAVFNVEHSHGDSKAHYLFPGPCEETLPKALGLSISVGRRITIETPA